ncbi:hypothetical protein E6C27_scaffold157G00080 [Cucumis melo var. makuwa]|uniref:Mucin-19-like n=1 Tax=Cucumis melo var. makuwa TaxID=1194695 RepID=A0A5A7TW18_CUCMM|nr:hypothetical protein E6C27_scaffold157G00080 [Cucumis melo var. makuwa]
MYNSLYTRLASSSHESFKQSRQIQVQKSVVRRLHAIFRSKLAGSPGAGVASLGSVVRRCWVTTGSYLSFLEGDRGLTLKFTVPRQVPLGIAPFTRVDLLSVDSIEGHNQVSSNVTASCSLCAIGSKELVVEGRLIRASFGITRLIRASFGSTRLICASFGSTKLIRASLGITRLIGVSFGITRLIRASFDITRLMCAFYETIRLIRVSFGKLTVVP